MNTTVRCLISRSVPFSDIFLVIESHSDSAPSLRIDKPFPALLQHAMSLDFDAMDPTDHGHVPYVVILVRILEEWKRDVSVNFDSIQQTDLL